MSREVSQSFPCHLSNYVLYTSFGASMTKKIILALTKHVPVTPLRHVAVGGGVAKYFCAFATATFKLRTDGQTVHPSVRP